LAAVFFFGAAFRVTDFATALFRGAAFLATAFFLGPAFLAAAFFFGAAFFPAADRRAAALFATALRTGLFLAVFLLDAFMVLCLAGEGEGCASARECLKAALPLGIQAIRGMRHRGIRCPSWRLRRKYHPQNSR
jgi:hypothetical protein